MRSEFTVAGTPTYDRRSPARWILSHQLRNPWIVAGFLIGSVTMVVANSMIPGLTGRAFDAVLGGGAERGRVLAGISLTLLAIVIIRSGLDMLARLCAEVMAKRMERDARDELYVSLLGKSQTFHNRQRVGDLMARAANDVRQLNDDDRTRHRPDRRLADQGIVPLIFIALLDWRLLAAPLFFAIAFVVSLRRYMRKLEPVSGTDARAVRHDERRAERGGHRHRGRQGDRRRRAPSGQASRRNAAPTATRSSGRASSRRATCRTLLLAVAMAGALLHGADPASRLASSRSVELVAYLGLMGLLRFPTFISIFTFALVQLGLAERRAASSADARGDGAGRERGRPYRRGSGARSSSRTSRSATAATPVLRDCHVPGRAGRDGRDRRPDRLRQEHADQACQPHLRRRRTAASWSTASMCATGTWTSLRSQISTIEQDVFLFSRSDRREHRLQPRRRTDREDDRAGGRDAQAHDFIMRAATTATTR